MKHPTRSLISVCLIFSLLLSFAPMTSAEDAASGAIENAAPETTVATVGAIVKSPAVTDAPEETAAPAGAIAESPALTAATGENTISAIPDAQMRTDDIPPMEIPTSLAGDFTIAPTSASFY